MAKKKTATSAAKAKAAKKTIKKNAKTAKKKVVKKTAPKKVAKKAAKKAAKKVAKKTAKKVAKKVAKKTAKKVAKKVAKKTAKKVAKKVAKKTAKKVTKKTAKKVTKKVTKKTAKKVTKKATKKAEPKKAVSKKTQTKKVSGKKGKKVEEGVGDAEKQLSVFDHVEVKKVSTEQAKQEIAEEIIDLAEDFSLTDILSSIRSIEFFKSTHDDCLEKGCDNPASTGDFCRYHYIKNWKDIKRRENILTEGKLQLFIEELVAKYPVKQLEGIIEDLGDEKSFFQILQELNIESSLDESDDFDDVDSDTSSDDQDIAFETKVTSQPQFDE